jgi:hypothetical protein
MEIENILQIAKCKMQNWGIWGAEVTRADAFLISV